MGFIEHLQNVATNNYDSLTELHIPRITVTAAHMKTSQSSLAVAWKRLPTADIPVHLGSRTISGLSYQLLTSHSCNSRLTESQPYGPPRPVTGTALLNLTAICEPIV
jgi:hypothetical protein